MREKSLQIVHVIGVVYKNQNYPIYGLIKWILRALHSILPEWQQYQLNTDIKYKNKWQFVFALFQSFDSQTLTIMAIIFFCYWYNLNHIPLKSNISQKRADLYFQRLSNTTTNSDCSFVLLPCFSMNHGTNLCLIAFSKKKKEHFFWFKVYYSWKWVWLVFVCATLYINWPIFCIMSFVEYVNTCIFIHYSLVHVFSWNVIYICTQGDMYLSHTQLSLQIHTLSVY